jgi:hypothetical protein
MGDIGVMIVDILEMIGQGIADFFADGIWQGLADLLNTIVSGLV